MSAPQVPPELADALAEVDRLLGDGPPDLLHQAMSDLATLLVKRLAELERRARPQGPLPPDDSPELPPGLAQALEDADNIDVGESPAYTAMVGLCWTLARRMTRLERYLSDRAKLLGAVPWDYFAQASIGRPTFGPPTRATAAATVDTVIDVEPADPDRPGPPRPAPAPIPAPIHVRFGRDLLRREISRKLGRVDDPVILAPRLVEIVREGLHRKPPWPMVEAMGAAAGILADVVDDPGAGVVQVPPGRAGGWARERAADVAAGPAHEMTRELWEMAAAILETANRG